MIRYRYKVWRFNRWKGKRWLVLDRQILTILRVAGVIAVWRAIVSCWIRGSILPSYNVWRSNLNRWDHRVLLTPEQILTENRVNLVYIAINMPSFTIVGFQTCQCLTSKSASHWHDGLPFIPLFLRVPIWFRPSCYYRYWFVSIQCHSLIGVDVLWCVALTLFHPYSLLQSSIFSTVFLRTALRQLRT